MERCGRRRIQSLLTAGLWLCAAFAVFPLGGCGGDTSPNQRALPENVDVIPVVNAPATPTQKAAAGEPCVPDPFGSGCMSDRTHVPPVSAVFCVNGDQCDSGFCVDRVCCDVAECPPGQFCDMWGTVGQCSPPNVIGGSCAFGAQCLSGSCVDRVCCDNASCPEGQRCDVPDYAGHCRVPPTSTPLPPSATPTPAPPSWTPTATRTPVELLHIGAATGDAGQTVAVDVTFKSMGLSIAGIQNDIIFDAANTSFASVGNCEDDPELSCTTGADCAGGICDLQPDCTVNPAIHKEATAFAVRSNDCTPQTGCRSFLRAIVFSFHNVAPIADDVVLYTCRVTIDSSAPAGDYPLTISNVVAAFPSGAPVLGTDGISGSIIVGVGGPTRTPTPTIPVPEIHLSNAGGAPGERVSVDVGLSTQGAAVVGTQNDIYFDISNAPIAAAGFCTDTPALACDLGTDCLPCSVDADCPAGQVCALAPDCAANAALHEDATRFAFQPPQCNPGTDCKGIRALVFSIKRIAPIADGSVLYSCNVDIAANAAAGVYPLTIDKVILAGPRGDRIPDAAGSSGSVIVGEAGAP